MISPFSFLKRTPPPPSPFDVKLLSFAEQRQNAADWCVATGYRAPLFKGNRWWAFPPNASVEVDITEQVNWWSPKAWAIALTRTAREFPPYAIEGVAIPTVRLYPSEDDVKHHVLTALIQQNPTASKAGVIDSDGLWWLKFNRGSGRHA